MKQSKRILAILLALALGLALMVPAGAAVYGDYPPVITKNWNIPWSNHPGDIVTLEVEARSPNGGELSYAWYSPNNTPITIPLIPPIATGPKLELLLTEEMVEAKSVYITLVIFNTYTDENSDEQSSYLVQSNTFTVSKPTQWWEWILAIPLLPIIIPAIIFGMGWVGPLLIPLGLFGVVSQILGFFGIDIS